MAQLVNLCTYVCAVCVALGSLAFDCIETYVLILLIFLKCIIGLDPVKCGLTDGNHAVLILDGAQLLCLLNLLHELYSLTAGLKRLGVEYLYAVNLLLGDIVVTHAESLLGIIQMASCQFLHILCTTAQNGAYGEYDKYPFHHDCFYLFNCCKSTLFTNLLYPNLVTFVR